MKKFRIKQYEIHTDKIHAPQGVRMILLADLHGISYGKDNIRLTETIRKLAPDVILSAGDMAVRTETNTLVTACKLLTELAGDFPVYYALGNHEYKMFLSEEYRPYYAKYERALKIAGVHILRNGREDMVLQGEHFCFWGLELPIEYYHKPRSPKLKKEVMEDLILSGHYHGGVVRLSEHYGLSSPQYLFLPPFCCGDFHKGDQHMIVSAGLGEHTIPLRIHNPRELLVIDIKPSEKMK